MKCANCGGALKTPMNFCSFCGVRQEIDLRQMHFRDLSSPEKPLPCPECRTPLGIIEVATNPPMHVERCGTCFGIFFNPGELEAVLHQQTEAAVRFDALMLDQVAADFGHQHEIRYRQCPMCSERMSHHNFGGKSAVIIDKCGTHGFWLDGGELRRLAEWWRAGGKHIHERNEAARVGKLFAPTPRKRPTGSIESPHRPNDWEWVARYDSSWWILEILARIAASFLTR